MLIGYARVSSLDQNLNLQIDALKKAGFRSVFEDKTSGSRVERLGRKGGRKRKMTDSKIDMAKKLLASGITPRDVAKNLGISVPTLYRWIPAASQASVFSVL